MMIKDDTVYNLANNYSLVMCCVNNDKYKKVATDSNLNIFGPTFSLWHPSIMLIIVF